MITSTRKAAYNAVLASLQGRSFAGQSLDEWRKIDSPTPIDEHFAREIALGAIRMARLLDFFAEQASERKQLKFGNREKALLRTAIYQIAFMDRTAVYAVVNESIKIAKKLGNPTFPGFLNAILRKLAQAVPAAPKGDSATALALRYSYPDFFVEQLLNKYPLEKVLEILTSGNLPPKTMARKRGTLDFTPIESKSQLEEIASSKDYYIQNYTPAFLIRSLAQAIPIPKTILDLCAAPGGKLVLTQELFPEANLFANEIASERVPRLQENIKKYSLKVDITQGPGEFYQSQEKFDLIILDVPCSNAGVLNKRPEARWRLNFDSISLLNATQLALIENASRLLSTNGSIIYMTCSILSLENEALALKACEKFNLKASHSTLLFPVSYGQDGGFGIIFQHLDSDSNLK